jgi:hypothetical protein
MSCLASYWQWLILHAQFFTWNVWNTVNMSLRFPNWTTVQFAALEIASGRCLNNIYSSEEIEFIENTLVLWGWKRSQNIPIKELFQRICSEFLSYSQINCDYTINPTYSFQNCLQNVSNRTPFPEVCEQFAKCLSNTAVMQESHSTLLFSEDLVGYL